MGEQNIHGINLPASDDIGDEMYSFRLALFSDADKMYSLWLPFVPDGFFRLSEKPEHHFLSISAKEGRWIASCRHPAYFQNVPVDQSYDLPLYDGQLIRIENEEKTYFLSVEKASKDQLLFRNYSVRSGMNISIGSLADSDIFYDNPYVSECHAALLRMGQQWKIQDLGSEYGVYINGVRCEYADLKLGDVIYIVGMRIVVGSGFLSISGGKGQVRVSQRILQESGSDHGGYLHYYGQEGTEEKEHYFNRAPRKCEDIPQRTIIVEGPPMSMKRSQMPLMLRMGSSMVMGGSAALAGNFTMLLSSVLFPLLSSKYTDKERQEYETLRLTKYSEYLQMKQQEIFNACTEERRLLNLRYPTLEETLSIATEKRRLWERRPSDDDFLRLRVGTGTSLLSTTIDYPKRQFELESDELEEKMYQMVEKPYPLEQVPITLSFMDTYVCGILGDEKKVCEYITQMVFQLAVFHSYDEVKMIFLLNEKLLSQIDFLRYLPHVWDDQRTMRFLATNEAEAYTIGEYIKDQIAEVSEEKLPQILRKRPFYVVFSFEKRFYESHEVFKNITQSENNPGASVIVAHNDLPKETQRIITLGAGRTGICTTMVANGGKDTSFSTEYYDNETLVETMRMIANTTLKSIKQAQSMPKMLTFLEMFGVGRIEQLNPLKRWRENNPASSLATPVGIGSDGSLFTLDLHEKRQGPHGLVAGMTGSGKSEFLITYILSLAVNYCPDEVAFVLIDYKGGGLAGAFENPQTGVRLPHLVGTITNLDGASIQRSLASIESELIRRQKIFNEIKSSVNEGTMDIYAYQKLYRSGKVSESLPHLFIISDEFAELKQQQPEFMEKLISAARIGRSLGVHLILATQKPSGVVNDQIRSNTKFRVCLRVQERSDSMDMLKRPEAAELTDTGRFYLQVGYNEYFALGQSAWCGAPYEPHDTVVVQRDDAIEFLDTTGQVISKVKPKIRKSDSGMKQIVAVVKYLSDLAASLDMQPRQLWKPELPKSLELDTLKELSDKQTDDMSVSLALVDDTENQTQFPLKINFKTCPHLMIAGESGSGKTVLLQNILYSLSRQLPPEDFNFYVLDYSSRMMKIFKPLPHCGGVLQEENADELDEFFKLINSIVAQRKRLFSELEVDNFEAARAITGLPLVLVVIDNIVGLGTSKKGEGHVYALQNYLKNSANYGVKYVVTCNRMNDISSRARQEFGERVSLHLADKFDYNEVLGCRVNYVPPAIPGRGLCNCGDKPMEFQAGIICADADDQTRMQHIKTVIADLRQKYGLKAEAQHLPVVKEDAEYEEFAAQFKKGRIPIGYSKPSGKPVALPLKQFSALSIYFGNSQSAIPVLNNMLYAAQRENMEIWVIKRHADSVFDFQNSNDKEIQIPNGTKIFSLQAQSLDEFRNLLVKEITERKKLLSDYCIETQLNSKESETYTKTFEFLIGHTKPIMLIVESYADFCKSADSISTLIYDKCFQMAQHQNIYVIGCFEPDDYKKITNRSLYFGFNPEANILLLGGQFEKQEICVLPSTSSMNQKFKYNVGVMNYRKQFYPVLIPCKNIKTEECEDDQSIF